MRGMIQSQASPVLCDVSMMGGKERKYKKRSSITFKTWQQVLEVRLERMVSFTVPSQVCFLYIWSMIQKPLAQNSRNIK